MNFFLRLTGLVLSLVVGVGVARPADSAEGGSALARLRALPITVYPEYVVQDSSLPAFLNSRSREGDAVVVSWRDALKTNFRVAKLGLTTAQTWLYIPGDRDLANQWSPSVRGIGAVLYIPPPNVSPTRTAVDAVVDTTKALGLPLIVGVEGTGLLRLDDFRVLCPPAQAITIYDSVRQKSDPASYRGYVERIRAEARKVNPGIKIEVCIMVRGERSTQAQAAYNILLQCADIADRVRIYCDDTPESHQNLERLFALLRG